MDVSVVICSHNRSESLGRLLNSICALEVPDGLIWEVLLVLNACSDESQAVAESFVVALPLRIVSEPVCGISHARNTSLRESRGEVLLCTDDDVTVPSDWLIKCMDGFARHPESTFIGGDIQPVFPGAEPMWSNAASIAAGSAFAKISVGLKDIVVSGVSSRCLLPFGANMGFRKRHLSKQQSQFDTELGRQPGPYFLGGEETSFVLDLLRSGHTGVMLANNPVTHWIESDRQSLEYIQKFYDGQGSQLGQQDREGSKERFMIARILSITFAHFFRWVCAALPHSAPLVWKLWFCRQLAHFEARRTSHGLKS